MSNSVWPHRWQPTRLPRPWDSPSKNTGVDCHFLFQYMKVKSEREVSVVSDSSQPHGLQPTRLLHPWDFLGKNTGVGCHCLLRQKELLLLLSHFSRVQLCDPIDSSPPGSSVPGILQARTLEWVAISFSNTWKWKVKGKSLSCVWLSATPWTVAYQAPPSMGFLLRNGILLSHKKEHIESVLIR